MKICKNDMDVILYPVTKCSVCAIRTRRSLCLWLRVVGNKTSGGCGGIMVNVLSDIFKL